MKYEIKVDRTKCIGNGMCMSIAPGVFKLDDNGKSTVYHMDESLIEAAIEAEENCPIGAISVVEVE